MPRSGTTLTESILTANDEVFGAGELMSFYDLAYRELINELSTGNSGCINIKVVDKKVVIKRNRIKKGKVLIESNALKNSYREFIANIKILHHPTTIKINYEPVIHCGTVSQSAKIFYIENDLLRTGDTSLVKFRFTIIRKLASLHKRARDSTRII